MKSLAATILDQRTETEQFFLEALQEVCMRRASFLLFSAGGALCPNSCDRLNAGLVVSSSIRILPAVRKFCIWTYHLLTTLCYFSFLFF